LKSSKILSKYQRESVKYGKFIDVPSDTDSINTHLNISFQISIKIIEVITGNKNDPPKRTKSMVAMDLIFFFSSFAQIRTNKRNEREAAPTSYNLNKEAKPKNNPVKNRFVSFSSFRYLKRKKADIRRNKKYTCI
jgi:hypothetical protein